MPGPPMTEEQNRKNRERERKQQNSLPASDSSNLVKVKVHLM